MQSATKKDQANYNVKYAISLRLKRFDISRISYFDIAILEVSLSKLSVMERFAMGHGVAIDVLRIFRDYDDPIANLARNELSSVSRKVLVMTSRIAYNSYCISTQHTLS